MADGEIGGVAGKSGGNQGEQYDGKRKKRGERQMITAPAANMPRDVFVPRETGRVTGPSYGSDPRLKKLMAQHIHRNKSKN